jgi:hypothetical protein
MNNSMALDRRRRTWVYVSSPVEMECGPCPLCGNQDYLWSTFKERVWCLHCKRDVAPTHWGILDGPVGVGLCQLLGIRFDAVDLLTGMVIPFEDPLWPAVDEIRQSCGA